MTIETRGNGTMLEGAGVNDDVAWRWTRPLDSPRAQLADDLL